MKEKNEEAIDEIVEEATQFLENVVGGSCSWLLGKLKTHKEKKSQEEEINAQYNQPKENSDA